MQTHHHPPGRACRQLRAPEFPPESKLPCPSTRVWPWGLFRQKSRQAVSNTRARSMRLGLAGCRLPAIVQLTVKGEGQRECSPICWAPLLFWALSCRAWASWNEPVPSPVAGATWAAQPWTESNQGASIVMDIMACRTTWEQWGMVMRELWTRGGWRAQSLQLATIAVGPAHWPLNAFTTSLHQPFAGLMR